MLHFIKDEKIYMYKKREREEDEIDEDTELEQAKFMS